MSTPNPEMVKLEAKYLECARHLQEVLIKADTDKFEEAARNAVEFLECNT